MRPVLSSRPRWLEPTLIVLAAMISSSFYLVPVYQVHGGLEFPLDDAYIYLQYARNLASGHFFAYWPGDGYTAGCTSPLYPLLLVPGFWMGLDDAAMVPYVYALNVALIGLCALVASRIGRRFAGLPGAVFAPLLLLSTGTWMWGALSGLEIALFTLLFLTGGWLLVLDADAEGCDTGTAASAEDPTGWIDTGAPPALPGLAAGGGTGTGATWRARALWIVAALLGVARPEGVSIAVLLIGCVLLRAGRRNRPSSWLIWPLALLPYLAMGLVNQHHAGHFVPNTAVHKSVMFYPRQSLEHVATNAIVQLRKLGTGILVISGGRWKLPLGAVTILLSLGWLGRRVWLELRVRRSFAALFLLLALPGGTASCLVARGPGQFLRYYHHLFALLSVTGAIGLIALLDLVRRRLEAGRGLVARGLFPLAALLLMVSAGVQLERWGAIFVQASREIRGQQVRIARWIDAKLPRDAYLVLNDVGAMTFLSHRRTFDIVGLTTNHQAEWFNEGPGALFERFERMPPADRPGYFAVYPSWIDLPILLGRELFRATVRQLAVAGGATAIVYEADWRSLGTGSAPASPLPGTRVLDALDVADLADEKAHGYRIDVTPAQRGALFSTRLVRDASGKVAVVDGGRSIRGERFVIDVPAADRTALRVRLGPGLSCRLEVSIDGQKTAGISAPYRSTGFSEYDLALPMIDGRAGRHEVEVAVAGATAYPVFHYWVHGIPIGASGSATGK